MCIKLGKGFLKKCFLQAFIFLKSRILTVHKWPAVTYPKCMFRAKNNTSKLSVMGSPPPPILDKVITFAARFQRKISFTTTKITSYN